MVCFNIRALVVLRCATYGIAEEHRAFVFLPGLRVLQTFLVDGMVAGTWKSERTKRAATLVVEPFGALTKKAERDVATEGEALLRFIEPDAESFDVRFAKPKKARKPS